MYLGPRLFALSVYVLVTFIFWYFISNTNKKYHAFLLCAFLLVLTFMGLLHYPNPSSDSFRLNAYMRSYENLSLQEMYVRELKRSSTPLIFLIYWTLSKFHYRGMLTGFAVFVTYAVVFRMLYTAEKRFKPSSKIVGMSLLVLMSTGLFGGTIDNIRTPIAFSLIAWGFYREMIEQKSFVSNLPLYLSACLIHIASAALLLLRLAFMCYEIFRYEKNARKRRKMIFIMTGTIIFGIVCAMPYLGKVLKKTQSYFTLGGYSLLSETIISFICIIIFWRIEKLLNLNYEFIADSNKIRRFMSFFNFVQFVAICTLPFDYNSFYRFGGLLTAAVLPVALIIAFSASIPDYKKKARMNEVIILSMIMMFISLSRGNLCSFKFFESF